MNSGGHCTPLTRSALLKFATPHLLLVLTPWSLRSQVQHRPLLLQLPLWVHGLSWAPWPALLCPAASEPRQQVAPSPRVSLSQ